MITPEDKAKCDERFRDHWKHLQTYHFKPRGPYGLPETLDEVRELISDAFGSGFEDGMAHEHRQWLS